MKKLILFFFFIYTFSCLANEQDTIEIVEYDSLSVISKNSGKEGFDFIVSGGLGIAMNSIWGYWEGKFYPCPVAAFGLEIPFTKSNRISFELYGHTWVSRTRENFDRYHYLSDYFIKIDKVTYGQMGLSTGIKFLILNLWHEPDKVRLNGHFGFLFISPKNDYYAIDFGLGLSYKLNDKLDINLTRRMMFGFPNFSGNSNDKVPHLLMLNICYKFKW